MSEADVLSIEARQLSTSVWTRWEEERDRRDGDSLAGALLALYGHDLDDLADAIEAGQVDAVLYSVGVNTAHGLRRTPEDKRRAVFRMLEDEEWSGCRKAKSQRPARCHASS